MPSPFPGMDPFLESPTYWKEFHHQLIHALFHLLQPGIADRYRPKIVTRQFTTELVLFTSISREPHVEEYIEIRTRNDGRLVTLIDVLSPTNKTTSAGKAAYLATRTDAFQGHRVGTVEIDLVTQGQPPLDFDRTGLPVSHYSVTVTRPAAPERFEVYASLIKNRLPKFKVPLAADDRDVVLDLQAAFARSYDIVTASHAIDYCSPLPVDVTVDEDTRVWIDQCVRV
ncbi:MAG: DUF4058 family protein [Gemmataceae bacterium]